MTDTKRYEYDKEFDSYLDTAKKAVPKVFIPPLKPTKEKFFKNEIFPLHNFEEVIWSAGDNIRILRLKIGIKPNLKQTKRIVELATNKNALKGRQTFILLLGRIEYAKYGKDLINYIDDISISGHIINTLYKIKNFHYVKEVMPFLKSERTWIRNEAKRYLSKASFN